MSETGRIDYSPDYKSEKRRDSKGLPIDDRGWPIMEVVDYDPVATKAKREAQTQRDAERARLERAVVEAAKADRLSVQKGTGTNRDIDAPIHARRVLNDAINALLEFESQQDQK